MRSSPAQLRRRLELLVVSRLLRLGEQLGARLGQGLATRGLSAADFRLVGVLMGAPDGLRQRELAQRLGVKPPTISAALPKLEAAGVVERLDDPTDPRAWRVRLRRDAPLEPGIELLEALEVQTLAPLSKADQKTLTRLLQRLETP